MKIGFLTLGRIGDMVLSTPAFSAIKKKYPNSEIYVVSGRGNSEILKNNPNIHQIIKYKKSPFALLKFIIKLRLIKFDYWIDPKNHYSTESKLIAKLCRANKKISFIYKNNNQNENKFFTEIVFDALRELNISISKQSLLPEIFLDNDSINKAKNIIKSNGKINLLINLSATSINRVYNVNNWCKVIGNLQQNIFQIYINSMETEKYIATEIINNFPNYNIKILPKLSINDISAVIKFSDLIITPDTSIVHIAAAYSKNIIALFTDNKPNIVKFGTNNPNAVIITEENSENVNQIPPEKIITEINNYLRNNKLN